MSRSPHGPRLPLPFFLLSLLLLPAGCGEVQVGTAQSVAALAGAPGGAGYFDGSPADPVRFDSPSGVAVTATGDRFVADTNNHVIRKIDASGNVTTFAGKFGVPGSADGTGGNARFSRLSAITAVGTFLYVCDNNAIRSVSPAGAVATLAGVPGTAGSTDGTTGPDARFHGPRGIASTAATILFVADTGNHRIRRVSTLTGETATVAGSGAAGFADNTLATAAAFNSPEGVAYDGSSLFVADTGNHAIRKITPAGVVTTFAGLPGTPGSSDSPPRFHSPKGIVALGSDLYVADTGNHAIRKIAPGGMVTTVAGLAGTSGSTDSPPRFNAPEGIAALGGELYVTDTGNHTVRRVTLSGTVATVAGAAGAPGTADGTGGAGGTARFRSPAGIASIDTTLYVADTGNHTVRRIASPSAATPVVSTYAGSAGSPGHADAQGNSSRFSSPRGIAAAGSVLFVADRGNHAVRRISSARNVTTFAGAPGAATTRNGSAETALLNAPAGIAGSLDTITFTDDRENAVRKILY